MMNVRTIRPNACQKWPFTRFQERLIASVPRRFSTTSAGIATANITARKIARDDEQQQADQHGEPDEDRDQEHAAEPREAPLVRGVDVDRVADAPLRGSSHDRRLQHRGDDHADHGGDRGDQERGTGRLRRHL